jgi:integrase/recombinase XerD
MPKKGSKSGKAPVGDPSDPQGMAVCLASFLEWLRTKGYSDRTVGNRAEYVTAFILWCEERSITKPVEVTRPILERYQRWLYHYRKENGQPLSFRSQYSRLSPLRTFFRYLAKPNLLRYNPASELELPKLEKRLPKHVLSATEAERIINQAGVGGALGVRDRAILETLYSTGVRRSEFIGLRLYHLDAERGTIMVRQGKGKKDRTLPLRCTGCAAGPRRIMQDCATCRPERLPVGRRDRGRRSRRSQPCRPVARRGPARRVRLRPRSPVCWSRRGSAGFRTG